MLPELREGNLDPALLAALNAVDAQVTADDVWKLEAARIGNAVLGLIVAPIVALGLLGFLAIRWYRSGATRSTPTTPPCSCRRRRQGCHRPVPRCSWRDDRRSANSPRRWSTSPPG